VYETPETLWSLRKAILHENFFVMFGYISPTELINRREGYCAHMIIDDHIQYSELDMLTEEYSAYGIKEFNYTLTEWITLPSFIKNQLIQSIKRVQSKKAQEMNTVINGNNPP
jgi:hypothetical protein